VPFPARLAIATKNPHKLRELGRICRDWPVEWLTVENHPGPWPDVPEPHETYLDNALEKARAIASALGEPAIADDSGIEVDALDGAPGTRSARFAGEGASDAENLAKLIEVIADEPSDARTARYRCVAVIAWPDGRALHAEGTARAPSSRRRRGPGGSATTRSSSPKANDARWPSSGTRRRTGSATAVGPSEPWRSSCPRKRRDGLGPARSRLAGTETPRFPDRAQVPSPGGR
jgi:Xanthosine triphosphate pyrophosphatase